MRRRRFIQWLAGAAAAIAIDPLIGGQSVWGTDPVEPKLLGVRGETFLESGYVWAPYIPVQKPVTILHEGCLDMVRARYSKKAIRSEYYGTVSVAKL